MCKAFSCIVNKTGKVYWKFGMDSHEDIKKEYKLKDTLDICPCEISPKNDDYLKPNKWIFKFDEKEPSWWKTRYEKRCWDAHKKWLAKLDTILIRKTIIHPFKIKPPEITDEHIRLLKEWDSVRDSVGNSVGYSVRDSVGNSVGNSVWDSVEHVGDSVWDSVWGSVGDSVRAYIGSFFLLKEWKYTKIKIKGYPFRSAVTLWEMGLVPSFDEEIWRLHGGKNAEVLFQISQKDLKKWKPKEVKP